MAEKKRKALGRGLSALLGDAEEDYAQSSDAVSAPAAPAAPAAGGETSAGAGAARAPRTLPIEKMAPGSLQPRTVFDEDTLKTLADSIKANGVLAPLIVRTNRDPEFHAQYEIISGERRWRAAQQAQLHEVPVIIRDDLDYKNLYEVALVDNLQRENLTDVEEAAAYGRLIAEFGHSQKAIGRIVGKSREHVANTLRLLKLPLKVLDMIETGELSAGHGRALLAVPASRPDLMEELAHEVVKNKWSVRELENSLKSLRPPARAGGKGRSKSETGRSAQGGGVSSDSRAIEKRLRESLGLRVGVRMRKGGRGDVIFTFESLEQFDGLLDTLDRGLRARRRK